MNEVVRLAAAAGLLIALAPAAQGGERGRDDEMVCVPAADGRSWECGTRANPPPERGLSSLPRTPSRAGPPPPFLAAPGAGAAPLAPPREAPRAAPARDAFPPVPDRDAPRTAAEVSTIAESAPAQVAPLDAPLATAASAPDDPPAAAPVPASTPPPAPPPMLAAPRPRLAPYAPLTPPTPSMPPAAPAAEPEPVAAEPVAAEPIAAEPIAPEPVAPEPVAAEPIAAEPARPPPSDTPLLADRDAFLALPSDRATLQLARATRLGELYATWQQLVADSGGALARGTAYVVTLDAGGSPQALLLWSDFADAADARAAWEALPGFPAGKPAAYARRIAPLQDEVRRAASEP